MKMKEMLCGLQWATDSANKIVKQWRTERQKICLHPELTFLLEMEAKSGQITLSVSLTGKRWDLTEEVLFSEEAALFLSPSHNGRAPSQPCPEACSRNQVAWLHLPAPNGFIQCQRDWCSTRVPIIRQVWDDTLLWDIQPCRDCINNSLVRLQHSLGI